MAFGDFFGGFGQGAAAGFTTYASLMNAKALADYRNKLGDLLDTKNAAERTKLGAQTEGGNAWAARHPLPTTGAFTDSQGEASPGTATAVPRTAVQTEDLGASSADQWDTSNDSTRPPVGFPGYAGGGRVTRVSAPSQTPQYDDYSGSDQGGHGRAAYDLGKQNYAVGGRVGRGRGRYGGSVYGGFGEGLLSGMKAGTAMISAMGMRKYLAAHAESEQIKAELAKRDADIKKYQGQKYDELQRRGAPQAVPSGQGSSSLPGMNVSDMMADPARAAIINNASAKTGIPPNVLAGLWYNESRGRMQSPNSSKNAMGPFQVQEAALQDVNKTTGANYTVADLQDPAKAAEVAGYYWKMQHNRPGFTPELASAAYNWGPKNVQNMLDSGGSLPPEVQTYVNNIHGMPDQGALQTAQAVPTGGAVDQGLWETDQPSSQVAQGYQRGGWVRGYDTGGEVSGMGGSGVDIYGSAPGQTEPPPEQATPVDTQQAVPTDATSMPPAQTADTQEQPETHSGHIIQLGLQGIENKYGLYDQGGGAVDQNLNRRLVAASKAEGGQDPRELQAIAQQADPQGSMPFNQQLEAIMKINFDAYMRHGMVKEAKESVADLLEGTKNAVNSYGALAAAAAQSGDWAGAAKAAQAMWSWIPSGGQVQVTPMADGISAQRYDDQGQPMGKPTQLHGAQQVTNAFGFVADIRNWAKELTSEAHTRFEENRQTAADNLSKEDRAAWHAFHTADAVVEGLQTDLAGAKTDEQRQAIQDQLTAATKARSVAISNLNQNQTVGVDNADLRRQHAEDIRIKAADHAAFTTYETADLQVENLQTQLDAAQTDEQRQPLQAQLTQAEQARAAARAKLNSTQIQNLSNAETRRELAAASKLRATGYNDLVTERARTAKATSDHRTMMNQLDARQATLQDQIDTETDPTQRGILQGQYDSAELQRQIATRQYTQIQAANIKGGDPVKQEDARRSGDAELGMLQAQKRVKDMDVRIAQTDDTAQKQQLQQQRVQLVGQSDRAQQSYQKIKKQIAMQGKKTGLDDIAYQKEIAPVASDAFDAAKLTPEQKIQAWSVMRDLAVGSESGKYAPDELVNTSLAVLNHKGAIGKTKDGGYYYTYIGQEFPMEKVVAYRLAQQYAIPTEHEAAAAEQKKPVVPDTRGNISRAIMPTPGPAQPVQTPAQMYGSSTGGVTPMIYGGVGAPAAPAPPRRSLITNAPIGSGAGTSIADLYRRQGQRPGMVLPIAPTSALPTTDELYPAQPTPSGLPVLPVGPNMSQPMTNRPIGSTLTGR